MRRSLVLLTALGLAACSASTLVDEPGIAGPATISVSGGPVDYSARTEPAGDAAGWLRTTVVLRALGPGSTTVEFSGCPVEAQLFRSAARTGSPAWTPFRLRNFACIEPLYVRTLAVGDTLHLGGGFAAREVLGDSLPPGRYYVRAVVRPNGGVVRLPAGEVVLAR